MGSHPTGGIRLIRQGQIPGRKGENTGKIRDIVDYVE